MTTSTLELKKKEIDYKIPCRDCETVYIGESGKSLQKQIAEYKYIVKMSNRKYGNAVHALDTTTSHVGML